MPLLAWGEAIRKLSRYADMIPLESSIGERLTNTSRPSSGISLLSPRLSRILSEAPRAHVNGELHLQLYELVLLTLNGTI